MRLVEEGQLERNKDGSTVVESLSDLVQQTNANGNGNLTQNRCSCILHTTHPP